MAAGELSGGQPAVLPELAGVYWRPRTTERSLGRAGRLWTLSTVAHTAPFIAAAVALAVLKPVTLPVGLILIAHAWVIPELYASRGANVLRARVAAVGGAAEVRASGAAEVRAGVAVPAKAEHVALGLLGDLLDHRARELHGRTRLVLEPGQFGIWLVGEAGAVLVRPGGRRVLCYCVKVTDPELPSTDRLTHLLLALREDEAGLATVANLVFSGATWRLGRRLDRPGREALRAAVAAARDR